MNTNDDRLRILTLVKNGRIEINEAIDQLRVLDRKESTAVQPDSNASTVPSSTPRILRILKTDMLNQKTLADITIPLDLLQAGMRVGANFYLDLAGLSAEQLDLLLNEPAVFLRLYGEVLLDLEDENTNEHISLTLQQEVSTTN
ncbi:MAG: hypothetical protein WBI14_07260 [Anaerolineaceae bacterium]